MLRAGLLLFLIAIPYVSPPIDIDTRVQKGKTASPVPAPIVTRPSPPHPTIPCCGSPTRHKTEGRAEATQAYELGNARSLLLLLRHTGSGSLLSPGPEDDDDARSASIRPPSPGASQAHPPVASPTPNYNSGVKTRQAHTSCLAPPFTPSHTNPPPADRDQPQQEEPWRERTEGLGMAGAGRSAERRIRPSRPSPSGPWPSSAVVCARVCVWMEGGLTGWMS